MKSIFLNRKKTIISKYKLTGQEKNNYSCMIASSGRASSRSVCLINVSANDGDVTPQTWQTLTGNTGQECVGWAARDQEIITTSDHNYTKMWDLNRCHTRHCQHSPVHSSTSVEILKVVFKFSFWG